MKIVKKSNLAKHEQIKIHCQPKLTNPSLVAAWPGVGNVALGAARYLAEKLEAKEFAEIEPLSFFDFNAVSFVDDLIQPSILPESKFYYWKNKQAKGDLIILLGEAQPTSQNYEFANCVLDVAQCFAVKRAYTFAGALISHFTKQPKVWGAATHPELLTELEHHGVVLRGDFHISGMNGFLLSVAKERGMEGICLLGEIPQQLGEIENLAASRAVLNTLTNILGIEIDMSELEESVRQASLEIEKFLKQSRYEFIDHFTFPMWKRPEDEGGS
jgi:hypothetical protein